jgi:hypothetical protein
MRGFQLESAIGPEIPTTRPQSGSAAWREASSPAVPTSNPPQKIKPVQIQKTRTVRPGFRRLDEGR